ncbi:uncharacterized protein LOC131430029 [Malaya genurostris]|uniref:uncharacterized protein LOC131430029 n=1 Tax=Malaya genurostris TaxID=325434 RepID=UPI0026F3EF70|nr:uncharacterized protein LOC131430029 [Malaya genurostris]
MNGFSRLVKVLLSARVSSVLLEMCREVIVAFFLCLVLSVCAEVPESSVAAVTPQTSDRPVMNNPAYDPTIYHKFVPQDAVQQYVHSYTGHNYPVGSSQVYGGSPYDSTAFATIPSKGFEGYLVPVAPIAERRTIFDSFRSVIPSARSVASFIGQVVSLVLGSAGVVGLGTLLTAVLCFFTPFCTLSFRTARAFGLGDATQQVLTTIGEQVTADRVKRAAELVKVAIDKFQHLNQVVRDSSERRAAAGRV